MTPRPSTHLAAIGRRYPTAWRQYEGFLADRRAGKLPAWPEWCFCPLAAAYAIISGGGPARLTTGQAADIARLGALAAWRPGQGIYRFDENLYRDLVATPVEGEIPAEVLTRLPEWCVYVETPDYPGFPPAAGFSPAGFFAFLESDANTGRRELRILFDIGPDDDPSLVPYILHLDEGTVTEALEASIAEARRQAAALSDIHPRELDLSRPDLEKAASALAPALSLLLYLCSEAADYQRPARRPGLKKTRRGPRLFPPPAPTAWDVGLRLGAALRRARAVGENHAPATASVRPHQAPRGHIRRAHWHGYWTGPRDPEAPGRRLVLKWLPPIPVNLDPETTRPAVIHPVRKE